MKKIIAPLIIFLFVPLIMHSQFHVIEKVEVYLTYGEAVQRKVEKIFLSNSGENLFYRGSVDMKRDCCILYDVKPDEYLFSFDMGNELVLAQHVYSIKSDPAASLVYSTIYYENRVKVRENRNLKIYMHVANEKNLVIGLVERKKIKYKDFDAIYFDYFIPNNNDLNKIKSANVLNPITTTGKEPENLAENQRESMARSSTKIFQYANQMKEFYEDYSGLFNDPGCSYCYKSGMGIYTLTLNEEDIKYYSICDTLKIKEVSINFIKRADVENQNLDDLEFGRQSITVTIYKDACKAEARDCVKQGTNCACKFDGSFVFNVTHHVYIRDELNTKRMLGDVFEIPCIVNNKAIGDKKYFSTSENARYFRQAMLEHEKLHCVQYRILLEAFFKGSFEGGRSNPFYFSEMVENDVRDNIANKIEALITEKFENFEGTKLLELPAWHFFFLKFNKYKWKG
jgi:hypothetical protein